MNILTELKKDHQEVKRLFRQIEMTSERSSTTRKRLFGKLRAFLLSHAKAEEAVLYARLRAATERKDDEKATDLVMEAFEEHHVAELLLNEISRMDPSDERWKAKLSVLKENVEHHVEEEESDLFKKARRHLGEEELKAMARMFRSMQEERLEAYDLVRRYAI